SRRAWCAARSASGKGKPSSAATSPSCSRVGTLTVLSDIVLARRRLLITASGQISHTLRPAALGVPAPGGHRKRITGTVGTLLAIADHRHFAFEHQQARIEFMGMLWVCRLRIHPAIDDLPVALRAQLGLEIRAVHRSSP